MNSVTLRLVAVSAVLALEAILIVLNIPSLSLVAGIVLLGLLLFVLGRLVSLRAKTGPQGKRKNIAGNAGAGIEPAEKPRPEISAGTGAADTGAGTGPRGRDQGTPPTTSRSRLFATVGTKIKRLKFPSRSRAVIPPSGPPVTTKGRGIFGRKVKTAHPGRDEGISGQDAIREDKRKAASREETSPAVSPKPRFETFRTMSKGLSLLFASRRRSSGNAGSDAKETVTAKKADRNDRNTQISLASVKSEAVSPVRQKREPSPFSPLEKDMVLDADLVLSLQEQGKDPASDILHSDIDTDSMEIFAPDSEIAHMDISLDDETSITIDEDEDDEVAQILEAHHDEIAVPAGGMEDFSIEKGLDELEGFDLDLDDVVPEGESGTVDTSRENVPSPAIPLQPDPSKKAGPSTMPATNRGRADESMLSFTSPSSGDDDLLSSLRSDMTRKKHQIDQSLVRDLKDVRIHIGEIEKDITELLALYKKIE